MEMQTKARPVRRPRGRRAAVAVAGLALALGAVAGCGSGGAPGADGATAQPSAVAGSTAPTASPSPAASDPAAGGPTASPSASSAPSPGTGATTEPGPGGPSRPGIAPGEPAPVPGGRQTISYQLSGNRLTVWFYGGVCEKYGLKVDESKPGQVGIRIVVTTPAPAGQACPAIAKRQSVTGDLAKPLMGRTVVDTDRGAEVPLESEYHGGPVPADQ
ncbi:hypothetical protein [Kitasatospora sp. NBC_00315]|uniref:hypothetical protein n=1 Tax=Kitasatospora sp. NBC_00315 TaxID=2975963 RepID=UPI00324530FB